VFGGGKALVAGFIARVGKRLNPPDSSRVSFLEKKKHEAKKKLCWLGSYPVA